ncbi:hypothetical protein TNCV_264291 [Trichonephila clavipes]|nr:hypothetical protein TNCV_264291 [Trichonephila clavipes]
MSRDDKQKDRSAHASFPTHSPQEQHQQGHLQHDRTLLPEDKSGATSTQDRPCAVFAMPGIFHSSKYCTRNPKCVKCGQPHLTRSCTKTSATCCNCQGNHPANFTGCPKNPSNKPPPTPKVKFWEERSRKRREMQEAVKAQADAARLIATSAPAYTPPPVRAAHPSSTTTPPVSAAPASVPTPQPVSTATVPRPRPAITPSTNQTSTPAFNSTSRTSNPPSTIAETLKQLRESKVVEIFQVLKQVIAICNSDMPLADRAIEVAALLQIDLPI